MSNLLDVAQLLQSDIFARAHEKFRAFNVIMHLLEELIKDVEERHESLKADLEKAMKALNTRIDDVEESSKSFVVKLREAITPRPAESHEKLNSQI